MAVSDIHLSDCLPRVFGDDSAEHLEAVAVEGAAAWARADAWARSASGTRYGSVLPVLNEEIN
jgi:hypothetical protein